MSLLKLVIINILEFKFYILLIFNLYFIWIFCNYYYFHYNHHYHIHFLFFLFTYLLFFILCICIYVYMHIIICFVISFIFPDLFSLKNIQILPAVLRDSVFGMLISSSYLLTVVVDLSFPFPLPSSLTATFTVITRRKYKKQR